MRRFIDWLSSIIETRLIMNDKTLVEAIRQGAKEQPLKDWKQVKTDLTWE